VLLLTSLSHFSILLFTPRHSHSNAQLQIFQTINPFIDIQQLCCCPHTIFAPPTVHPWLDHRPLPRRSPKCKFHNVTVALGSLNKASFRTAPLVSSLGIVLLSMQLISPIHLALRVSNQLGAVRRSLCPDLYDTRPSKAHPFTRVQMCIATISQTTDY
jgi:hypothetical protein